MIVWLELGGKTRRVELPFAAGAAVLSGPLDCVVDGRPVTVDVQMLQPGVMSLMVDHQQYRSVLDGDGVWIAGQRFEFAVEDPRSLQGRRGAGAGSDGPRPVKAPMPGRVVRVLVQPGDEVIEGAGVVVIEAMKMQNELKSPKTGKVVRVAVEVGGTVGAGDVLAVVE
jgi:biotin carboxyl carrier protein